MYVHDMPPRLSSKNTVNATGLDRKCTIIRGTHSTIWTGAESLIKSAWVVESVVQGSKHEEYTAEPLEMARIHSALDPRLRTSRTQSAWRRQEQFPFRSFGRESPWGWVPFKEPNEIWHGLPGFVQRWFSVISKNRHRGSQIRTTGRPKIHRNQRQHRSFPAFIWKWKKSPFDIQVRSNDDHAITASSHSNVTHPLTTNKSEMGLAAE